MSADHNAIEAVKQRFTRWVGHPEPMKPFQPHWCDVDAMAAHVVAMEARSSGSEAAAESNLRRHAERELDAIGEHSFAREQLLEIVDLFASHGHSGSSAPWAIGMLERLLAFEPIAPLSGAESEWMQVGADLWQNVRCSHVFKSVADGPYDIEGRIFREADGSCFTSRDSRVAVVFPYTPTREYVDAPTRTAA